MDVLEEAYIRKFVLSEDYVNFEYRTAFKSNNEEVALVHDWISSSRLNQVNTETDDFLNKVLFIVRGLIRKIDKYSHYIRGKFGIGIDAYEFWLSTYSDKDVIFIVQLEEKSIVEDMITYSKKMVASIQSIDEGFKINEKKKLTYDDIIFNNPVNESIALKALERFSVINENKIYIGKAGEFALVIKVLMDNNVLLQTSEQVVQSLFSEKIHKVYKRCKSYSLKDRSDKEKSIEKFIAEYRKSIQDKWTKI